MSLLNDMLRDLSHHKPVADGSEGYDETLLGAASFSQKKYFSWGLLILVFVVIFISVLAINYTLHKFVFNESSINAPATVQSSPVIVTEKVTAVPAIHPHIDVHTKNADESINNEENINPDHKSEELTNHINDLLQQAERALGMDRLSAPVEDNAYNYYQKILGMDASNEDAKAGLDEIARRYLAKAQEQFAVGNTQAGEALIQRARFVSARYVLAHEIPAEEYANQYADIVAAEASVEKVQSHSKVLQEVKGQSETKVQSEIQPTLVKETIKPFNIVEAKTLSVSPNAAWKDEQLAQHAQELIKQNKPAEAQVLLKNFIAAEKNPVLSATLLADIYIQQGNTEAAAIVADQADYLPADIRSKIKAQISSANGNNLQAIAILEKDLTAAEDNEGYRSLLASLYHKTANYQQSIISYQRLINRFGEKPAYWLGLALAYDGLSQYHSALQAYQRLREFPQLQEQVTQYTDQRIAALRSN